MFTKSFQRALTVILLGLTFATLPSLTYAVHSWNGYHWARTANPFTLKLDDNLTTSDWKARLAQASQDWNSPQIFTTTSPLVTVIRRGPSLIETDNGSASSPQIAMDASGNAITVWDQFDGARHNIWANRYTTGNGWGAATLIETDNVGPAIRPQIAMNTIGDAIAVWYQGDGTSDNNGPRHNIWANRYTSGSGWGAATLIETNNAGTASSPQIAIDATGNAVAVWEQSDGARNNIWANRYTAGSGWGGATLIESNNAGHAGGPQITMDANGNAIAVWFYDGHIWANRYTASSGWGAATQIETNTAKNAISSKIAMDATGNAIVVWSQGDGARDNIWANRYTAGSGWGVATMIETDNGTATSPQITMNATGNAVAVWSHHDGTRWNIWANRYTVGSGWGAATLIETDNAGNAYVPQITMDANDNAVAVWYQLDGMRYNIWANRLTASSGWGAATLIETNNAGSAYFPRIAMSTNGNAVAVWYQFDGITYNIWATSRFTAPNSSCAMVAGTTQVCNGNYGSTGWLGLASVNIINGTSHITQGIAQLNDTYFNTAAYNNPNQRQHVMCQEIAHTFGLHHQSEDGSSQNSCMDYFSNTGLNATSTLSTRPNLHDFDQLNIIYSHLDTTTTLAGTTSLTALVAASDQDTKNWGHLRSQSSNGRSSTYERHNSDGTRTITHVYWTLEAAVNCPSCDHRYDH